MNIPANPLILQLITPYQVVPDVAALPEFPENVFGASQRRTLQYREDKTVHHTGVKIEDFLLLMGEPMGVMITTNSGMNIYIKDCITTSEKVLENSEIFVLTPAIYAHGNSYRGVKDAAGNNRWKITHAGKTNP